MLQLPLIFKNVWIAGFTQKTPKRVFQKSVKMLNQCLVAGEQVSKTDAVSVSSNTSALEKGLSEDIQQRWVGGSSHQRWRYYGREETAVRLLNLQTVTPQSSLVIHEEALEDIWTLLSSLGSCFCNLGHADFETDAIFVNELLTKGLSC